jgi:hypothetical protein
MVVTAPISSVLAPKPPLPVLMPVLARVACQSIAGCEPKPMLVVLMLVVLMLLVLMPVLMLVLAVAGA